MKYNLKIILLSLILLPGILPAAVEVEGSTVVFNLEAPSAESVYLTGDFNDWSETATPMEKTDGIWRVELELEPRRYEYKFLVDGAYVEDPDNPETNPDPYGGVNSVLLVPMSGGDSGITIPEDATADRVKPIERIPDAKLTEFSYSAPDAKKVSVAGDFNDWSTDVNPMEKGENGIWRTKIELIPGKYEYKFVVDGNYVTDPKNPETVPDPYGGENSLLVVGEMESKPESKIQTQPETKVVHGKAEYTFEYYNPGARQVHIAGDFNSWSPNATEMESDGEGNWSKTMALKPGTYAYKFVVDGNWQPDPNNPRTKSDGYGGINSIIEISKSGEVVELEKETGVVERMSNTFANSRVYIGGKYTGIMESRWNRDGDKRFRLDVPRHRMEAYMRVTVSDNVKALGALSFDTKDADRIYETSLAMDSAAVQLETEEIYSQIYYNRPIDGLGDPLEVVGNSAVVGSPEVELPFGLGTGGLKAESRLFGATLTALYADRFDSRAAQLPSGALLDDLGRPRYGLFIEEAITPSPDPNEYAEYAIDILAGRISRPFGPIDIGASLRRDYGNWWYSYANLDLPALDDWIDSTGSTSDWFAVGKTEMLYGGDVNLELDFLSAWAEYVEYSYKGGVVAGNRENDARDNNGPIDLELGARDGHLAGAGIEFGFFDLIEIGGEYSSLIYSAPEDSGFYLNPEPSTDGDGRIDMGYYGIVPDISVIWWEGFDVSVGINRYLPLTVYGGLEKIDDSFGSIRRDVNKFGFAIKGSLLWDFFLYDIYGDWASAEYSDGSTQLEFLSKYALSLNLTDNWYIGIDAVYHTMKADSSDGTTMWDDVSIPVFTYIQYSPVENVRMQIYWGVHPAMANGWVAGRREFIDDYMRENDASFATAWEELEDVRQIGFRGEIDF